MLELTVKEQGGIEKALANKRFCLKLRLDKCVPGIWKQEPEATASDRWIEFGVRLLLASTSLYLLAFTIYGWWRLMTWADPMFAVKIGRIVALLKSEEGWGLIILELIVGFYLSGAIMAKSRRK